MKNLSLNLSSDLSTLEITPEADEFLFNDIAKRLEIAFDGKWTAKITGLDQRYWDLKVGSAILTLHLEHYLGISLFVAEDGEIAASRQLLLRAHELLSK
ncbi:hypothetical protein [Herbaspirillum lusitanum]|uniref:hypothetical protein n=1 Tax=Herbaspirillum lusitanum TaxID=213312 RepID=UPI00068043EF|nr:hypothetical protein [Herbaspirillum lusitanum]